MRKMLFAIFAMGALVSCLNEEILDLNREQIAFGEVFVDNGTRADYSQLGKPVTAFKVYGTATGLGNTVQIFNGADVTRPNNYYNGETGEYNSSVPWVCTAAQYWLPKVEYKFAAIVDGAATATTGLPETIPFTVADGDANFDLLYAEAQAITDVNGVPNNSPVAFTFRHLLSKMQFEINKQSNQEIEVMSITVTGFVEKGIYDVEGDKWAQNGSTTTTLNFINSDGELEPRQILPIPNVEQVLDVTIKYKFANVEFEKSGTITQEFEQNTVYVVTATLTGVAIDFSIKIDSTLEWGEGDSTII